MIESGNREDNNGMQIQENKMGVMPVNKLLITMSLPMMISMIVQALYNIVDSIFVSQVSEAALTAVSLAFPLQILSIAVGAGTGVGINAILSRSLGEKDFEKANKVASNGVFLTVMSYLVFVLIGIFAVRPFFMAQTNQEEILNSGISYLSICLIFSIGVFTQMTFERLLQSTGKTFYTMITQGTGAIINIILDPILIFGWFGLPAMGATGAALATVIGQMIAATLAIIINHRVNHEVKLTFRNFKPDGKIIGSIYSVGIPSIIMQAIGSIMTYGMNQILIQFTSTATAVFGVYFKLQSFILMPVFGLNNGMIPIVAYNYGAANKERVLKTIRYSVFYAIAIMLIGLSVFQIFPTQLLMMFNASPSMLEIGVPALRIISLSFLFAGYCIMISSVFQALGNGIYSMVVSIARQLVVLLPAAYLLSKTGELSLVWWAFPASEIMSLILCTVFLYKTYHDVIAKL